MKTFLRWVAFLPAAVAAFFLIQFINALIPIVPNIFLQWWNSWAGSIGFIVVGSYVAPKFKFVIGIVLAIVTCFFVVVTFRIPIGMPIWNVIICDIFSLFGAFAGAACAKALEDHEKRLNGFHVDDKELVQDYRIEESIAEDDRAWKELQKRI